MKRDSIRLAGTALFLLSTGCRGDAAQANAISLEDASVRSGEFFPRSLYDRPVDCSLDVGLQLARPMMVLDDFQQRWFSSHLAAAAERPLVAQARGADAGMVLRFIWLPTFDNPVIVRLEGATHETPTLVAIRLSGAGGYDPGNVADRLERPLTGDEWARIQNFLARSHLLDQQPADCTLGLDGSEWIVEAIDREGYHFIKRWSPENGAMHEFGSLLLELTGWRFDDVY